MKEDSRYEIDIYKLKNGEHAYDFIVDDAFFANVENSPVEQGTGKVHVLINKQERMIDVHIHLSVSVPLECDKTLKPFDYLIDEKREVIYKYGDQEEELDDDLYIITRNTQRIDFAQLIYEFICVAIPMRKVHPDHPDEVDEDELIYKSEENTDQDGKGDDPVDPRWSKLKDLN